MILPQKYHSKVLRQRMSLVLFPSVLFIAAFVLNVVMNQPLFNTNLNLVPYWQSSQTWGNSHFMTFMNVVSNIFNPLVCAGYIVLFFLFSYRKLEILVFLIWFIFLSYVLSILKLIFHQARPYWIQAAGINMLQWTCYTEYGMPSGHSMMAIILMEFIIRFFARVNKYICKFIVFFYCLMIVLQFCVMLSRVMLGMHSLNQVLIGCLIGCFSFVPYYIFIQKFIQNWVLSIFRAPKSPLTLIILTCLGLGSVVISVLISLLIEYKNYSYTVVINSIKGCDGYYIFKSFQYKCLQDSSLLMGAIGILYAFCLMKNPSHLQLQLNYGRISLRFLAKIIVTLFFPLCVVAFFVNPLWYRIQVDTQDLGIILWACQIVQFFLALFLLVWFIPIVNNKLGFQRYKKPQSYVDFKKFESLNIDESSSFTVTQFSQKKKKRRKETQLTQSERGVDTRFHVNISTLQKRNQQ